MNKLPAEAIEAAARGIASANLRSRPWGDLDDETRNHFRRDARAALEATLPYLLEAARKTKSKWWRKRSKGHHLPADALYCGKNIHIGCEHADTLRTTK